MQRDKRAFSDPFYFTSEIVESCVEVHKMEYHRIFQLSSFDQFSLGVLAS